jgi:hypothetical protein
MKTRNFIVNSKEGVSIEYNLNDEIDEEIFLREMRINLLAQGFLTIKNYLCKVDNDSKNFFYEKLAKFMDGIE